MVLDTSAIFALIAREDDAPRFENAILAADTLTISAVTVLETSIVPRGRLGVGAEQAFRVWLGRSGVAVIPFDHQQAIAAGQAFARFGKGQGDPAQLNICDCASYALAKTRGEPLLFKGSDFSRTDVATA